MIVVAIIAILATIALPAYQNYITRSKLTDAQNGLQAFRVSMEQFYQDNRSYANAGGTCGASATFKYFTLSSCVLSASASGVANQRYVATATGIGPVSSFSFTIDNTNARTTSAVAPGWGTAPVACWVVRKGGTCS